MFLKVSAFKSPLLLDRSNRYFLEGEALVKQHADDRENVKLRNARKFQRIPGVLFFFS